jgi:hypothetical protein
MSLDSDSGGRKGRGGEETKTRIIITKSLCRVIDGQSRIGIFFHTLSNLASNRLENRVYSTQLLVIHHSNLASHERVGDRHIWGCGQDNTSRLVLPAWSPRHYCPGVIVGSFKGNVSYHQYQRMLYLQLSESLAYLHLQTNPQPWRLVCLFLRLFTIWLIIVSQPNTFLSNILSDNEEWNLASLELRVLYSIYNRTRMLYSIEIGSYKLRAAIEVQQSSSVLGSSMPCAVARQFAYIALM